MKAYVTFEKDGYGGEQIEKVFANEELAQDHIIETRFALNMAYADFERHELEEKALEYIEGYDVVQE